MTQSSSLTRNTDSLVAAMAGFCIIFLFTRHGGIGISPDGVVYSSVAENIKAHGALQDYNQNPVINFPVLYPVILSAISFITGLKPVSFAPVLNALLFAFVVYLCGQIMDQFVSPSKWYKRLLLTCIVLSPCLLEVYSMLWSETFFIVWLLLFLIMLRRYFQTHAIHALLITAVIAALASVTRYAGITIIGTVGLLLLLDAGLPFRKKLFHLLLFVVISPALLVINLTRNYTISATLTGLREKAIRSLNENMHDTGVVFSDWLPFFNGHYAWAVLVSIFVITMAVAIWATQRLISKQAGSYEHIAVSFLLVYLVFMIASASLSRYEQLNGRLLSPVFISLLWCGSSWLVPAIKKATALKKKWLIALGAVIFISFQYTQLMADYETWDGVKDAGIPGYTEDEWKYAETVQYIQKNSILFRNGYTIYSNADDAIYFYIAKQAQLLPHKEFQQEINDFLNNRYCYVVWFNNGENPDLVDLNFITTVKKMRLLKQFTDGAIYISEAKP
jgi:hypothetical protein